ncbi:MAG: hypothetical protein R2706_12285 [Acidimicrobiales bacterium]
MPAKPVTAAGLGGASTSGSLLGIRLSEGMAADLVPVAVAEGQPLSDAEIEAVLSRLPEWDVPDETTAFARPAESLKPPLVGVTIDAAFPPAGAVDRVDTPATEPLEVLRFQPEGEVEVAPFLTVTFNQPMVALATLDQLDDTEVPVELSPSVAGRWRWIGTRTLRFEVLPGLTDRLPMATESAVKVPKGTTSAGGAVLADDVIWTFATPPAVPVSLSPESPSLPTTQVFALTLIKSLTPTRCSVSQPTADGETPGDTHRHRRRNHDTSPARRSRGISDRSNRCLTDAALTIVVGLGTPSAEGPVTTSEATTFTARTYAPLKIVRERRATQPMRAVNAVVDPKFNNTIDRFVSPINGHDRT